MRRPLSLMIASLMLASAGTTYASLADGQPYAVGYDAQGLTIDGEYRLLRGGSLQWFRIPAESWRDRLEKFKAAGFNTVDIYVPWNLIEPREGEFQFSEPDLATFLRLC
ncbi:MAG: beta-galactosidase, partial [Gammaproteobacteria bacterium]|nr:beta-galactosidase [Gammaproteobacteria bacterium]